MNTSRQWLHTCLPHVLTKVDRVSFGLKSRFFKLLSYIASIFDHLTGLLTAEDIERLIAENGPTMPKTRNKQQLLKLFAACLYL